MDRFSIEMLSIGDELLTGRTVDTNGATLGRLAASHGWRVTRRQTVPDVRQVIVEALREALARVHVVVVSGGLGPTTDDDTRYAAAALAGVGLAEVPEEAARIRTKRAALGLVENEGEHRMATLPLGARAVANDVGIAPGFVVTVGDGRVLFLPGVPSEFTAMLTAALPGLMGDARDPGRTVAFSVFGLYESELDRRLRDLERLPDVRLHFRIDFPTVRVALVARGDAARPEELARLATAVRERIGDAAYAEGDVSLAEAVHALLVRRGAHLAVAESCTGGLVGHLLTEVSGMSAAFELGLVTYSNAAKEALLGVPADVLARVGAVSRETVTHMAEAVRARAGADLGVAISGIAGPTGGSPDKPVGTVWLALATPTGTTTAERRFRGSRSAVKSLAAATALDLVRRYCETEA